MRQRLIMSMLFSMLVLQYPFAISAQVVAIQGASGTEVLTNNINSAGVTGPIRKIDKKAEGYIFPLNGQNRRPVARVERILTGVFSGAGESVVAPDSGNLPDRIETGSETRARPKTSQDKDTIAWKTNGGLLYHDPFLECATGSERLWVNSIHELCGLQPCPDCFQKNGIIPAFISKESGGLDVATAGTLLSNADFIAWAQERLPIRNPGFISTQKLIVYPKMEMTRKGLHQLARETELAYRRMTWKTIEVLGKQSEIDTENISSFDSEVSEEKNGKDNKDSKDIEGIEDSKDSKDGKDGKEPDKADEMKAADD